MEMLKQIKSLFLFLFSKKKYWLIPLVAALLLIGLLLFVFAGSTITPFIYTIF
ncbi:MAG: DUF5989 family protein [bacterium]|nr:DUF5989 family protein [bacterium]